MLFMVRIKVELPGEMDPAKVRELGEAEADRAIELIENERPDAAVIDVDLPDMTGIEVAAKVSDMTPAPKVILMSGYDEAYIAACCEKKRAWAVIEKPVPLRVVAHHLCRALERV